MDGDTTDNWVVYEPSTRDRCVNCGTLGNLHKYDGELHCDRCLNERLAKE